MSGRLFKCWNKKCREKPKALTLVVLYWFKSSWRFCGSKSARWGTGFAPAGQRPRPVVLNPLLRHRPLFFVYQRNWTLSTFFHEFSSLAPISYSLHLTLPFLQFYFSYRAISFWHNLDFVQIVLVFCCRVGPDNRICLSKNPILFEFAPH